MRTHILAETTPGTFSLNPPPQKKIDYLTYASSFPFSSAVTLSLWLFSLDWHPMARYWATSGWTRLSICVLFDGSISSLCSTKCASAVSAALCWLVNEHYTIKSHPACLWGGGRGAGLVTQTRVDSVLHQALLLASKKKKKKSRVLTGFCFDQIIRYNVGPSSLFKGEVLHLTAISLIWNRVKND